jgi:DNA gyrase/topoisomerase IV subunit A
LAGRIREEISEIEIILDRIQCGWERVKQSGDEFYLDSVALNLHSFYTALERVFELIATTIDQEKPQGENWHQELLRQMAVEIEFVRPVVISKDTRNSLDEYRGFRHIVRNVYSFNLSAVRIEPLVKKLPNLFNNIKNELEDFLNFLEMQGKDIR